MSMTQPAKGQEPSMEEILASIRRIIADEPTFSRGEPPRPAALPREVARNAGGHIEHRGDEQPRTDEGGMEPPADEGPLPVEPIQSRPADETMPAGRLQTAPMRPLAAQPSSTSPDQDVEAMLAQFHAQSREPPAPIEDMLAHIFEAPEEMQAAQAPSEAEFALDDTEEMPEHATETAEPDSVGAPVPAADRLAPEQMRANPTHARQLAPQGGEQGLVSAKTSAAVESAFNTLAQTVLVQNGRTLEDLVREMLRPMLKTWLDDNLPNMVERLVRAEIERVSRGR
jgi:cell pole-organizing protein PopZ